MRLTWNGDGEIREQDLPGGGKAGARALRWTIEVLEEIAEGAGSREDRDGQAADVRDHQSRRGLE